MNVIHTDQAPKAIGPYSQAIEAGGFLWCSGQIPLDPVTMQVVEGDAAAQAHRCLENLKAVAAAAGTSLDKAVRCGLFLVSMDDFAAVNAVYEQYFPGKPARTTVEVSRLPRGVRVEVDCVIFKG
jgi:2-iminobutanoate/2-iminopropanoate deaminase